MTVRYRPDIDGLRAIAIIPVVLFHYGFKPFSGGFVGVDIFFVISGFLITSLIRSEIQAGRFSLVGFYDRRMRRIFPALFFVIAVTAIFGYVLLFPIAYTEFGQSAVATSAFLSNLEFWREAGYFDIGGSQKPLLHTWSLAVEEQFYLFFPPLMMFTARYLKGRYLLSIVPLLLVSLLVSVIGTNLAPDAAFYFLPARMWELMLGALLAVGGVSLAVTPLIRNILAGLGLAMIGIAVVTFSSATPFPGFAALLPCIGAGLIIFAGADGQPLTNRLLATAPFVFVGQISYSLYLWHWPLYVFARYYSGHNPGLSETLALIAAAFTFAMISWRYVEHPFRRRQALAHRGLLFAVGGATMAATAAMGLAIYFGNGLPGRFDPDTQKLLAVADARNPECPAAKIISMAFGPMCRIGLDGNSAFAFIFWGDSHAKSLSPAIDRAAARTQKSGLFIGIDACPPLLGVEYAIQSRFACAKGINDLVAMALSKYHVNTVIISARWAIYAAGTRFKGDEGTPLFLRDSESREISVAENARVFRRGLKRTIDFLRNSGHHVILVGPWPEIGTPVPEALAKRRLFGETQDIGPSRLEFMTRESIVFNAFHAFAGNPDVEVVYPHERMCDATRCQVAIDGKPLYWDGDHLSVYGALYLQPLFDGLFSRPWRDAVGIESGGERRVP